MAHTHPHPHHHHTSAKDRIKFAFFLNLSFTFIELAGGLWTNSMAVLSDAVHDLGDSLALGLAWGFQNVAERKVDAKFSYGYRRFSLLAALINAVIILVGVVFILSEAIPRLFAPEPPNVKGMLIIAIVGVLVNGLAALRVSHGKTINERAVTWHLLEDLLGWVAVFIVSIVMLFKEIPILDPILSILISLFVAYNVIRNLKAALTIFLQAVPVDIDLNSVEASIQSQPHVAGVHHTQVWSLDGEHHVLTSHVLLDAFIPANELTDLKDKIRKNLSHFNIVHSTLEFEFPEEVCLLK